jgi:soluble lytic murein transglycosylase-like protein
MKKFIIPIILVLNSGIQASAGTISVIERINSQHFNLPKSLIYGTAKVESNFNCGATGKVGEIGAFQMKLQTARGVGYQGSRAGLYNCETNAYYSLKHLSIAYAKCGSILGAAKLHNAGLGASCSPSQYSYKVLNAGNRIVSNGVSEHTYSKRGSSNNTRAAKDSNPSNYWLEHEKIMQEKWRASN